MRSWVKALLMSAMTLLLVIIFLPNLAKPALNSLVPWALKQAKFEQIEIDVSHVSWYQLTLNKLSFSSSTHSNIALEKFSLQKLDLRYNPFKLITGQVNSLHIEQLALVIPDQKLVVEKRAALNVVNVKAKTIEPEKTELDAIILPSAKEIFARLPMNTLMVEQLSVHHPKAIFNGQLKVDREQLSLHSTTDLIFLNEPLNQQLSFNNQGALLATISSKKSAAPIFILQGQWLENTDNKNHKTMSLSVQQSADIQTWLSLINNDAGSSTLLAKTAIQVWSQELNLPKLINNPNDILQYTSGEGLFQIKINDFNLASANKKTPALLSDANVLFDSVINFNTGDDQQTNKTGQLTINNLDFEGITFSKNALAVKLQQQLNQPLIIDCMLNDKMDINCLWQGKVEQRLQAKNIDSKIQWDISGDFANSSELGSTLNFRNNIQASLQQNNKNWPRFHNTTSGDIVFSAEKNPIITGDDFWHWQMNLPFGLNGKTNYNEILPASLATGELSQIHWQLLPDWQLKGINAELTNAKAFSLLVNDVSWVEQNKLKKNRLHNKSLILDQASLSCAFDWLKLQYSPQLRSNGALKNLPLACEWKINNTASQWQQWPLPAFEFSGDFQLSSLDFQHAKMRTEAKITGLNKRLDLSLHAQHDFSGKQKGAAQLYLNNLNLEWQELGLAQMMNLTQAQLLGGTLSAQGWIQWQQYQEDIFDDDSIAWRWQPDIMLRVDDLAGIYNNTTAWDDVDFQMAIRRPFYQSFKVVSQISANSINPGINVSNILARSTTTIEPDFSKALIVIEEMHSDVLGGRVKVPLIRFDTSQEINAFGIEIEGLQVSQLAELEAKSSISATGTLDGVLPIILLPEGPQVPAGSLYARAPGGVINYNNDVSSALKGSDPSVGLVMQALEDFHYDKLQTNVTYQPNGELRLGLQFQGKNPEFFDGQATHLNLNLDYNLLDLLESLRISNDIVQKLENKYQ